MLAMLDRPQPAITHEDLMLGTTGKLASWKGWIYEQHDGYRCLTRRSADRTSADLLSPGVGSVAANPR